MLRAKAPTRESLCPHPILSLLHHLGESWCLPARLLALNQHGDSEPVSEAALVNPGMTYFLTAVPQTRTVTSLPPSSVLYCRAALILVRVLSAASLAAITLVPGRPSESASSHNTAFSRPLCENPCAEAPVTAGGANPDSFRNPKSVP